MAELVLYTEEPDGTISLGEVGPDGDLGEGDPTRVFGRNIGETTLHRIIIELAGEGAASVRLARDSDGRPGVWASPGESIVASVDKIQQGDTFIFWAQAIYDPEDAAGEHEFRFNVRAVSG